MVLITSVVLVYLLLFRFLVVLLLLLFFFQGFPAATQHVVSFESSSFILHGTFRDLCLGVHHAVRITI